MSAAFLINMQMQDRLRAVGHSLYGMQGLKTDGGIRKEGGAALKLGSNDAVKGVTRGMVDEQASKALSITEGADLTTGRIEAPTPSRAVEAAESKSALG